MFNANYYLLYFKRNLGWKFFVCFTLMSLGFFIGRRALNVLSHTVLLFSKTFINVLAASGLEYVSNALAGAGCPT